MNRALQFVAQRVVDRALPRQSVASAKIVGNDCDRVMPAAMRLRFGVIMVLCRKISDFEMRRRESHSQYFGDSILS